MYRGKNQDYSIDETLFSKIKSVYRNKLCICRGKNQKAVNSLLLHFIVSPVFVIRCNTGKIFPIGRNANYLTL